jgi:hypothetical protein
VKVDITKIAAINTAPTGASSDSVWIKWITELESRYGADDAATIFTKMWSKRGNEKANTLTLRQALKKYGIVIEENSWDRVTDIGRGVEDALGSLLKIGKVAAFAVGGIVVLGLGLFVYNVAKSPDTILSKIPNPVKKAA